MEILKEFNLSALQNCVVCIMVSYGAVAGAMAVDFVVGIRRAKKSGNATRSRGLRMTCKKALGYFLPMLVLTFVDLIGMMVMPLPAFTMLMGAFNIFCEWKSVLETTRDKEEIRKAAHTMEVIVRNREDIAKMMLGFINEVNLKSEEEKA